ncbi:hypothetical protein Ancab_030150 [Ancistrocladus abbreviatus]
MCSIATILGGTDVVAPSPQPPSSANEIMSFHDVVHQPEEQFTLDEISSPISTRIFEFCDPDLFSETLHNSEVNSSSNCCYEENSPYTANLSFPSDVDDKFRSEPIDINKLQNDQYENANMSTTTTTTTTSSSTTTVTTATIANSNTIDANNSNLSIIFDSQEDIDDDISASIDFSPSSSFSAAAYLASIQPDQLDFFSQVPVALGGFSQYPC